MIVLSTIIGAITWLASNLWVLLLALLPQVLSILQPILTGVVDGLKKFIATLWEGASQNKWEQWVLAFTIAAVSGVACYYYGWDSCIKWVHEHFRLITKVQPSVWWKFW